MPTDAQKRLILPQPISIPEDRECAAERALLAQLGPGTVMMCGDNDLLPKMPARPTLLDFFRLRFGQITCNHLLQSARRVAALVALAAATEGAAVSASEMTQRATALRPLERAARKARVAAYNAAVDEPR